MTGLPIAGAVVEEGKIAGITGWDFPQVAAQRFHWLYLCVFCGRLFFFRRRFVRHVRGSCVWRK
jgi:hypothetical protein